MYFKNKSFPQFLVLLLISVQLAACGKNKPIDRTAPEAKAEPVNKIAESFHAISCEDIKLEGSYQVILTQDKKDADKITFKKSATSETEFDIAGKSEPLEGFAKASLAKNKIKRDDQEVETCAITFTSNETKDTLTNLIIQKRYIILQNREDGSLLMGDDSLKDSFFLQKLQPAKTEASQE